MKQSLQQNKDIFNILFEAASEGIIVVNKQHLIVAANKAAVHMFGYADDELVNQPLNLLIPTEYQHSHPRHVDQFITQGAGRQMGHGRDLYGIKKNGNRFPVEAGLNPFEIAGKKYVMSLVIDISIRKETQRQIEELNSQLEEKIKIRTSELSQSVQQLQQVNLDLEEEVQRRKEAERKIKKALQQEKELNELKTKFLSLVSHEFKTPLSGILSSATLTGKYTREEQQEKREKHLRTIRNKVHYLNNILNDFLSIERLDSGKGQYKLTDVSLKTLLNEVIYNAQAALKPGQQLHYPEDLQEVNLYQDAKICELILSNILGNAIKYSPENTSIKLKIDLKTTVVNFEIIDAGRGIPEKDQKHIFERYFRAENALLDQGTGIGLNITKAHVKNLGGEITFKSTEGKGTTFLLSLPINAAPI